MRTFISDNIQKIIDLDGETLDTSVPERCISITGGSLQILGRLPADVTFCKSKNKKVYVGNFLVCTNISYDCVLGWDFLVNNNLDLREENFKGTRSYRLVGPHGKSSVNAVGCETFSKGSVSGVLETDTETGKTRGFQASDNVVLAQSHVQASICVSLKDDVIIQGRTEMIVEGRIRKSSMSQVGMISPLAKETAHQHSFHVAHAVVKAEERCVPIRILNALDKSIELCKGRKIAEFSPLISSSSKQKGACCGAISSQTTEAFIENKVAAQINPSLNAKDRETLSDVLSAYQDVFEESLGHTNVVTHKINTGDSPPIRHRPRRLPYAHREEAERQINEMLNQGVIRPSSSPWSSPIVLVKKRNGEFRFCVDYRRLNQVTQNDSHPLPNIADILDSLGNAKYFSTLDLRNGYWQISIDPKDRPKSAFVTSSGLFEFNRMSFGLTTAPATFQRAMEIVLAGLNFDSCLCYLDDVICFGRSMQEHNNRLQAVLERFREHNLRVKLCKCQFAATEVSFLGHRVSQDGVSPDPEKVVAIKRIPKPSCVKEVRSFLGLAGYYRRFIKDFATLAAPLTKLTTKEVSKQPFTWTNECDMSFIQLRSQLCTAPILAYPKFDRLFTLYTDASDVGLGAVLSQNDDNGVERVVAYASRALSDRERNYATTEKEALAIQYGTQHFRLYLLGRHFKIVTDHSALKWLSTIEPKGRIGRWIMDLQEFQFSVEHRAGKIHQNADALSRLVLQERAYHTSAAISCTVLESVKMISATHRKVYQTLRNAFLRCLVIITYLFQLIPSRNANMTNVKSAVGVNYKLQEEIHEIPPDDHHDKSCLISLSPTINLEDAQRQDKDLALVIDYISQGKNKPSFDEWKLNPTLRNIWHNYDRLFLHNDLLVRSRTMHSPHPNYALVIPNSLVDKI